MIFKETRILSTTITKFNLIRVFHLYNSRLYGYYGDFFMGSVQTGVKKKFKGIFIRGCFLKPTKSGNTIKTIVNAGGVLKKRTYLEGKGTLGFVPQQIRRTKIQASFLKKL